jgi:hypothetical protein
MDSEASSMISDSFQGFDLEMFLLEFLIAREVQTDGKEDR